MNSEGLLSHPLLDNTGGLARGSAVQDGTVAAAVVFALTITLWTGRVLHLTGNS